MRLNRRGLVLTLGLAVVSIVRPLGAPAWAEEAKKDDPSEKEIARSVQMDGLVFPVFTDGGKLKNYLFVNARMLVGPGKDPWKYRSQGHVIRDAVLRAAHKTSFNIKGDINKLDEALAARECLKAANASVGDSNALISMTFIEIASQAAGR